MEFTCRRCGHKANNFTNLRMHLEKAQVCPANVEDVPRETQLAFLESQRKRKVYSDAEKTHVCVCGKAFAVYTSLSSHKGKCDVHKNSAQASSSREVQPSADEEAIADEAKKVEDTPQKSKKVENICKEMRLISDMIHLLQVRMDQLIHKLSE